MAYFTKFSDPKLVIEELTRNDIPAVQLASAIEFALCFGTIVDAQTILDRFLAEHSKLVAPAIEAAIRFREQGVPNYFVTSYAEEAALMSVIHKLLLRAA